MKKIIAVFDFDGTISKKDTYLDFLFFTFGRVEAFLRLIPFAIFYFFVFISVLDRKWLKEKIFSSFFKGWNVQEFNQKCQDYTGKRGRYLFREEAVRKITWHREKGHEIIVVSASIENLIKPQARILGVNNVLSNIIEIRDWNITGKFLSKNCWGIEKVNRLKEFCPDLSDFEIYGYGNSRGDKEFLEISNHKFFKKF